MRVNFQGMLTVLWFLFLISLAIYDMVKLRSHALQASARQGFINLSMLLAASMMGIIWARMKSSSGAWMKFMGVLGLVYWGILIAIWVYFDVLSGHGTLRFITYMVALALEMVQLGSDVRTSARMLAWGGWGIVLIYFFGFLASFLSVKIFHLFGLEMPRQMRENLPFYLSFTVGYAIWGIWMTIKP